MYSVQATSTNRVDNDQGVMIAARSSVEPTSRARKHETLGVLFYALAPEMVLDTLESGCLDGLASKLRGVPRA